MHHLWGILYVLFPVIHTSEQRGPRDGWETIGQKESSAGKLTGKDDLFGDGVKDGKRKGKGKGGEKEVQERAARTVYSRPI